MRYRYPGPKPFTEEDEALFFGRTEEKEQLNTIVQKNKLTVLFGRSGYGKSSLIQAGVVPWFKNVANYKIIEIRFSFSSTNNGEVIHPRKQFLDEFKKHIKHDVFLSGLQDNQSPSLWQLFKTIQWEAKQEKLHGILLIMDQFEEIFNFPQHKYANLSIEFADLVYNRMPSFFQATLMNKLENDIFREENKEQIDFIDNELPSRFLIGIRSDRLYLLDELGEVIPTIFNNRFKLKPLLIGKIKNIIEQPARNAGDFLSPPFSYSPELIEKISGFFESKDEPAKDQKTIEAFELQIICKYIEEKVIANYDSKNLATIPDNIIVDNSYLPNDLNEVIKHYYINIITGENEITKSLSKFDLLIIRYLIERKLIDTKTNSRICLDKISIIPLGFNDDLLAKLTETRIIRRELNTVTGQSYEISHDTLLQPIQDAVRSTEIGDLTKALSLYYHDALKNANQGRLLRKWGVLEKKFLNDQNNITYFSNNDFAHSQGNDNLVNALVSSKILNTSGENSDTFILNEAFQDVVSSRIKNFDFSTLKATVYALLISIVVISCIVFLFVKLYKLSERERLQRITENLSVDDNDEQVGKEKLLVFNYAFDQLEKYPFRKTTIPQKLVNQFNWLYLYADTIARQNPGDSIIGFQVSPNGSILVHFKNKNSGPDLAGMSVLYNKNFKILDSFPGINNAQFIPQSDKLVIFSKDSIHLYKAGLPVKLHYNGGFYLQNFTPLLLPPNDLLFGEAGYYSGDNIPKSAKVLIDLRSGLVKLIPDCEQSIFYLNRENPGFIRVCKDAVWTVDFAGNQRLLNRYSSNNNSVIMSQSSQGRTIKVLNAVYSTGYAGYSNYPGNLNGTNDTLRFLSFNKIPHEKTKIIPSILSYYNENGFLIIASADSIRIFDDKLNLIRHIPMPKPESDVPINSITSNQDFSKILFTTSDDSTLTFINTIENSRRIIHMPRAISGATFSRSGKIIFCAESPVTGQKPGMLILNSSFKTLGKIYGIGSESIHGDLVVSIPNRKIISIDPEKVFSKFNNTDSSVVSRWVNKKFKKTRDTYLKKYKIRGNVSTTLKDLIENKY